MNARERVLTALNHEEPDRVPIDMPFTPEAAQKLAAYLKEKKQVTVESSDLQVVMGHDILVASHGIGASYYSNEAEEYICEWGIGWKWITLFDDLNGAMIVSQRNLANVFPNIYSGRASPLAGGRTFFRGILPDNPSGNG